MSLPTFGLRMLRRRNPRVVGFLAGLAARRAGPPDPSAGALVGPLVRRRRVLPVVPATPVASVLPAPAPASAPTPTPTPEAPVETRTTAAGELDESRPRADLPAASTSPGRVPAGPAPPPPEPPGPESLAASPGGTVRRVVASPAATRRAERALVPRVPVVRATDAVPSAPSPPPVARRAAAAHVVPVPVPVPVAPSPAVLPGPPAPSSASRGDAAPFVSLPAGANVDHPLDPTIVGVVAGPWSTPPTAQRPIMQRRRRPPHLDRAPAAAPVSATRRDLVLPSAATAGHLEAAPDVGAAAPRPAPAPADVEARPARAPLRLASPRPAIRRAFETPPPSGAAPTAPPAPPQELPTVESRRVEPQAPDVGALADEVYERLLRRLAYEREGRGGT